MDDVTAGTTVNQSPMSNQALIDYFRQMGLLNAQQQAYQQQLGAVDALRGGQDFGDRMVSGHYVRRSPLEGLQQGVNTGAKGYLMSKQLEALRGKQGVALPGAGGRFGSYGTIDPLQAGPDLPY